MVPLLVWGFEEGGGGGVNAFATFTFAVQFKSGTDQSNKPKTPKFISKSLFTPLV